MHASVVMESGYNYQFIRDLLMEKGYRLREVRSNTLYQRVRRVQPRNSYND